MKTLTTASNVYDCLAAMQAYIGLRFVIGASFPMRHLRDIHDVDVIVHPHDWEFFKKLSPWDGKWDQTDSGLERYTLPKDHMGLELPIEFFGHFPTPGFSYLELEKEGFDHWDMLPTWTLSQCIRWKRAYGRPKDQHDVQLAVEAMLREPWMSKIRAERNIPKPVQN